MWRRNARARKLGPLSVHLLGLERLAGAGARVKWHAKPLEQPELGRRAVGDAHMRIVAVDVAAKCSGEKARPVVGDQERGLGQRPVQAFGLGPRHIEGRVHIAGAGARREVAREQVARVVVDDRDRVPPPVSGDVQIGHVGLPQLVRGTGQQLEQPRRLVELGLTYPALLQQSRRLHHLVDLLVGDPEPCASGDDRDALVAPPRQRYSVCSEIPARRAICATGTRVPAPGSPRPAPRALASAFVPASSARAFCARTTPSAPPRVPSAPGSAAPRVLPRRPS